MGLVFALQPDLRKSSANCLTIRSSKKKFGLGGSFVFGGALLGTMFLAAAPLFRIFWEQGSWVDRLITLAVVTPIVLYPLLAIVCWFYQESITIQKLPSGLYNIDADESVFGLKWNKRHAHNVSLDQLQVANWMGSRNVASIAASQKGTQDRYATRGHWMLKALPAEGVEVLLERRAKKDEIDFLKAQIEMYFDPARVTLAAETLPSESHRSNPGSPTPHT